MPPLLRSRAARVAALVTLVLMGAVGFVPLFGGPGYESALAAGVLVPSIAAIATALEVARHRPSPLAALARGIGTGLAMALVAYLTTLAHGLRAGFCDAPSGTVLFALGPAAGAAMGGAWGALAGEIAGRVRRPRRRAAAAVLLALAGPLGGVGVSLLRFFTSPMIFAYDPFAGFFSGALYDTVIEPAGLVTYRAGSLATLAAAALLASQCVRRDDGEPALAPRPSRVLLALAAACGLASFAVTAAGDRLGHWHTAESIAADLGARTSGELCEVVHARAIRASDAALFARDCDEELRQVSAWFEVPPPRVRAYLFRDAGEKRRLMGAADTYIAKPWRREVYLQVSGYPHPVLGHELAHVVAGAYGRGPFRIAGGLLSNPGLVEGVAVAASPDDDDLAPAEWARAMLDQGILPSLARVFAMGFFTDNASRSYTVAGAFVTWARARFGMPVIGRWYGGEPLDRLTGVAWPELEAAFREHLRSLTIPPAAAAIARARFERPSVFGRRCPHVVDASRREASRALGSGDYERALDAVARALRLDPHEWSSMLQRATCFERQGRLDEARDELARVAADASASRPVRDRALAELGDLDLATGDARGAARLYEEVAARALDEDVRRTLDVKLRAAGDERARAAIAAWLVGTPERGVDTTSAAALLGRWSALEPDEGLPEYLLARAAISRGAWDEAGARLDRALAARLEPERVRREALRLRAVVSCARGDRTSASRAAAAYADAGASAGRRAALERLVARCGG